MPRPREFDIDTVLDKSMQVFWQQGYKSTSMEDLMKATRLQKQSLYCAFGDKHTLFLKALERYRVQRLEKVKAMFSQEKSPVKGLESFLNVALSCEKDDEIPAGCLIMSTVQEFGSNDSEVIQEVMKMVSGLETLLDDVVQKGQQKGEITTRFDSLLIAKYLLNTLNGLRVAEKRGETEEIMKKIIEMTFVLIKT
jgi:TetR/AcrR family transcriptional regulator, transcriptional repressor for nem operon